MCMMDLIILVKENLLINIFQNTTSPSGYGVAASNQSFLIIKNRLYHIYETNLNYINERKKNSNITGY